MNTPSRCIITSVSNKFFPSLLNLLGSLEKNYPGHPRVYVYDLGLSVIFRKELENIKWITVIAMPHFISFWRSCYTWKAYIFIKPLADINIYMDAGCEILRPLDEMFTKTIEQNYLAVEQTAKLDLITPTDYKDIFRIDPVFYNQNCITAGIFGFKKNSAITTSLEELYDKAINGLCLGFSPTEQWKNKGVNKNQYVRNCERFRHDTTILSLILRKNIPNLRIEPFSRFAANSPTESSVQLIWNLRMNYRKLNNLSINTLHKKKTFVVFISRAGVYIFMIARAIRLRIKLRK
jgi:hypothetical protein